ncbi:MAG: murein biosynthesis integral membrane protein MurJ [Limnochordia bacterium]
MAERPVARTAGLVMVLILLSRLLGFIRERSIAIVFGSNWQTDVFRQAFNIPDLMYFILVAGGLNAAFIPTFTSYLARDEEEDGWRMAWTFFTLGFIALVLMTALGVIFSPSLSYIVGYAYEGETRRLLIKLMRIMFPAVFFTALAGLGMGVHKSYKSFNAPLWGPILYNAVIILGIYLLGGRYGVVGMGIGTVAGACVNFLIQMPFFIKKARPRRYAFQLHHPGIKQILYLMGPAVISSSIAQLNFIVSSSLASSLAESSVSALRVANTLVQLPLGVFGMGVSMVILPTLAGLKAKGEIDDFREMFSQGIRFVLTLTIPAAVGLAVLRVPLVRLLFEGGAFTSADTLMTAQAVLFYAPGLISQAVIQVLVQVYYSLQDTKSLVKVSLNAILVNATLSLAFLKFTPLAHGGLALASSLTSIINLLNYLLRLRKHLGRIDAGRMLRCTIRSLIASAVMGFAVWGAATVGASLFGTSTLPGRVTEVAIGVGTGGLVYLIMIFVLRMEETTFLYQVFRRNAKSTSEAK